MLLLLAVALFDVQTAERFARLALDRVAREYPNKIAHVMNSDRDAQPPRQLTPAFYGCYDWHSSVHGHWLLARLVRTFPEASFAPRAREALERSLTSANIGQEVRYLDAAGRASFERPYGLAWLLQLGIELREWDRPEARRWSAALEPLERAAAARLRFNPSRCASRGSLWSLDTTGASQFAGPLRGMAGRNWASQAPNSVGFKTRRTASASARHGEKKSSPDGS